MMRFLSLVGLAALLSLAGAAPAQFSSGSNGSDGALTFEPSDEPVTIMFDPASFDPPLDPDGDGVYHFTTITIPQNVTVRVLADKVGWQPLYWLATGDVVIDGVLDLSGENGRASAGGLTIPGPGGFPGGVPPEGPGIPTNTNQGRNLSNNYLNPLTGGGSGKAHLGDWGGAGGGAILIASTSHIRLHGSIRSNAGNGSGRSLGGAGGSIHLLTPDFSGNGTISVNRGSTPTAWPLSESGWVRIEAAEYTFTGTFSGDSGRRRIVTLIPDSFLIPERTARSFYTARMARIGGIDLPNPTTNSFIIPDVVVNTSDPITFEIEARNIPLGTRFQIVLKNEELGFKSFTTLGLEGTIELSVATLEIPVDYGYSSGFFLTWFNEQSP